MGKSIVTFCWINTYKSGEEDKHGRRWTDTKTHRIRSLLRCDGTGDGAKRRVRERGAVHSTRENFCGDSTTNRIDTLSRFSGIFYFFNERRSTIRTLRTARTSFSRGSRRTHMGGIENFQRTMNASE